MKVCSYCGLSGRDSSTVGSQSTCNYCRLMMEYRDMLKRIGRLQHVLKKRLQSNINKPSPYDCLVGFSGGKDSSYILYRLRSYYDLNVLAYTLDNGFLTEYAKHNIATLVKKLGVDHVWIKPPQAVLKKIYANNLISEGWQCSACFHMMEASAWKLAWEERIPFIVSGRTPEQILRRPERSLMQEIDSLTTLETSDRVPQSKQQSAQQAMDRIRIVMEWLLPDAYTRSLANDTLYLRADYVKHDDFVPEAIPFFIYEEHDEKKIIQELVNNTNWRSPEKVEPLSHADCLAHDAATFLFYKSHNTTIFEDEVRSLLRMLRIDAAEAVALILISA